MTMSVSALFSYPVKGLGGRKQAEVELNVGQGLPGDRRFALAKSDYADHFDPTSQTAWGSWAPKRFFVCGMADPKALGYQPLGEAWNHDGKGDAVHLEKPIEGPAGRFDLADPEQRTAFAHAIGYDGPLELVRNNEGLGFCDQLTPFVSLANVATARWLADRWGLDEHPEFGLHPDRFKNNIWLDGLEPWAELDWIAGRQTVALGQGLELRVVQNVGRCANINANPLTGANEPNHLQDLAKLALEMGHMDTRRVRPEATFGVFAMVTQAGRLQSRSPRT